MRLARRTFIAGAAGVAGAALLPRAAFADPLASLPVIRVDRRLVPVAVDPARVIRTTVGLRPFRPSGFVLAAEPLGEKLLVHDYGHGGGGMSLSWGCATLAADLVGNRSPSRAAIIGCGVIGLSTARVLQDRGWDVHLYAAALPPNTTSNLSGAQWSPVSVYDDGAISSSFHATYLKASAIANRAFQLLVGPRYGVRWIENYALRDDATTQDVLDYAENLGIVPFYADVVGIDPASTPFAAKYVRRFATMLIEPNTYLPALVRDVLIRGGKITVRTFASLTQLRSLPEPVVFNCTGLGARDLVGDKELIPIRGQITILEPQADVDYITFQLPLYMFPRSDGILLGGTHERGDWSTTPDMATQARILQGQAAIYR